MSRQLHGRQQGFSLVEIMLVLVIAAGLMSLGVKVYKQFTQYRDEQQLYVNVEQLLTAMRDYYQANCRLALDSSGNIVSAGTLDPTIITATTLPLTINSGSASNTDLVSVGFLSTSNWQPVNPLVNTLVSTSTTSFGSWNTPICALSPGAPGCAWIPGTTTTTTSNTGGYYLQFNRIQTAGVDPSTQIYACAGTSAGPTTCNVTSASYASLVSSNTTATLQSAVVFWTAQVSVLLANPAMATGLLGALDATCITQSVTATCETGAVTPTGAQTTLYLVWERPAAMLTQDTTSDLWMSSPVAKQFNMQYTNDGMASLSGVTASSNFYNTKNYLCGG